MTNHNYRMSGDIIGKHRIVTNKISIYSILIPMNKHKWKKSLQSKSGMLFLSQFPSFYHLPNLSAVSKHVWAIVYVHQYNDVIIRAIASQITDISIVYSTVCSGTKQRKYLSSTSLSFVTGIPQWPVNSPHKGPVTQKRFLNWWRHHDIQNVSPQFNCSDT